MKLLLLLTLLLCGCTKDYTVFYCPEKKVYKDMSVADSLYLQEKSGCKMEIVRGGRVFYSRRRDGG
jgi:nitrous oxide reductase accessory protein NosL